MSKQPSRPAPRRYFYHSFPRRSDGDETEKGLRILKSIVEAGLLLSPEKTTWQEPLSDGTLSKPWHVMQTRACFTELDPSDLGEHREFFGHFALEFEIQTFRQLGGIPVFYLPRASPNDVGLESVAAMMCCRMGEIQRLLNHLGELEELIRKSEDMSQPLVLEHKGVTEKQFTRTSLGGVQDVLKFLTNGCQPASVLRNALAACSGFFYPAEDLQFTDLLGYYRQREWRIVADMEKHGEELTRDLTDVEVDFLLDLDEDFFGQEMEFRSGTYRRADLCKYFEGLEEKTFLQYARRVIVPPEALKEAEGALSGDLLPDVVASTEV